ncbi:MAG: hypothetical protein AB7O38_24345 [Pirellulaceae bacterium]
MDTMQADLRSSYPLLDIQIIGVNEFGQSSANAQMMSGRSLPWLQDGDANGNQESDIWYDSWSVTYRDVVILGGDNESVGVYNLTSHSLADTANYAELRQMLVNAAMAVQKPWQNPTLRFDVNGDGYEAPLDVLTIINSLNRDGPRVLPPPTGTVLTAPYFDTDGDGHIAPFDVLQAINHLNRMASGGEGESPAQLDINDSTHMVVQADSTSSRASTDTLFASSILAAAGSLSPAIVDLPGESAASMGSAPMVSDALPPTAESGEAFLIVPGVPQSAESSDGLNPQLSSDDDAAVLDPLTLDVVFAAEETFGWE